MGENDNNNSGILSKQELWDKAGSNERITRVDVGVPQPMDNSGMQSLNEGYLGTISTFSFGDELKHSK